LLSVSLCALLVAVHWTQPKSENSCQTSLGAEE
jgi:hypothetical protein